MEMYCNRLAPAKSCPDRCYVFFPRPHDPEGDVLYIRAGRKSEKYRVWECYPDDSDGRGWRLHKLSDGTLYTVYLHRNGQDRSCDCPGASYGASECRHLSVVLDLLRVGAFDPEPPLDNPLFDGSADPFA